MRKTTRFIALTALFVLVAAIGGVASADERQSVAAQQEGQGEGLKFIKNIETGTCTSGWKGTDNEVRTIKGRDYAFANSFCPLKEGGGIYVIDVTSPAKAKIVAHIPCVLSQGDVQISADLKTLMVAHDSTGGPESCTGLGKVGFITVDITNPKKPKVIGHADTNASHNITAHPKKPFVYNSTSDLAPPGDIQIWSIKNPAKPKLVNTIDSLPHAPHDISFNSKGTKAVTAAISHFDVFDTTDPANPTLTWTGQCPGCTITHDAKFLPNGKGLLIGDEGGGGLPYPCPGGAWYFYDFNTEQVPVLTGVYWPANFVANQEGGVGACTSHVFDISDDGTKIAISWYTLGTRYLDITSAVGATVGGNNAPGGIIECGWYVPPGADSWSSKFSTDDRWIFSNDIARGFDIFKITAECG